MFVLHASQIKFLQKCVSVIYEGLTPLMWPSAMISGRKFTHHCKWNAIKIGNWD